jgi:hypothetical protein
VLLYLKELRREYSKDPHFDDLFYSISHTLRIEDIEERKNYTPKELLHLYDEEVE